ncbi:MAG: hypothetical protein L3K03_04055 [Thermoplasmata archaeon]|nr:hypothetical protein [Thermoplasmata archaeon]
MSDPNADLRARVDRLESDLRNLLDRLRILERNAAPRAENQSDQRAVQQKVTYDWQS